MLFLHFSFRGVRLEKSNATRTSVAGDGLTEQNLNSGFLPLDIPKTPMGSIYNIFVFGCDRLMSQEVKR